MRLVGRSDDEWNIVAAEKPTIGEAIFPFSVLGLVVSLVLTLVGILLRSGDKSILVELVSQVVVDAGTVAAFAAVSGLVARRFDAVRPAMAEVAAIYSCVGIWMTSALGFIPVPALGWLWYLMGVVYTGYLWMRALDVVVGVAGESRTRAMIASGAALVIVAGVLRGVRYAVLVGMGVY